MTDLDEIILSNQKLISGIRQSDDIDLMFYYLNSMKPEINIEFYIWIQFVKEIPFEFIHKNPLEKSKFIFEFHNNFLEYS